MFHAGATPSLKSSGIRSRGSEPIKTSPAKGIPRKRGYPEDQDLLEALTFPLTSPSIADMYRKIRLGFLAIIFLLCLTLDSGAKGQLNFSTGWGKRSHKVGTEPGSFDCGSQARPTLEQVLSVYNLIQTEAQRMQDCRKLNE